YALIFGNWGAPELGVTGAAIASVVTQLVSLVAVVIYAVRAEPEHRLFQRFWRPDWEMLLRVLRLGVPIGLTTLAEVTLFAASTVLMGWLGQVPLAAHGIAMNLTSATFMVHIGLSNVATIRAGNALGRRDRAHLEKGAIAVTVMSLVTSVLTIILFLTCAEPLISLFMEPDDPQRGQILAIGTGLLAVAALFQLVDGAQVIALGLLRGLQDAKVPMMIAALSYWVVGVPASYFFGFVQGMEGIGVWLGLVLGLACAGVLLLARFWLRSVRKVGVPAE
ncbi:MATE family efflux transporter, partial [Ruegeria sp.]|uniref:MATE family efflux transporter n=1 Tax=Ruegeria sp. TaxID=1879320 RepID=UPI00230B9F79